MVVGLVLIWLGIAKFADGMCISATVAPDAEVQKAALFTQVGNGEVAGTGHGVYKDDIRVLYRVDGWEVYCVYYG